MDAAVRPCEECPYIRSFVIGGVVPDHMNDALVRVASFNFGEQLRSADPIDGGWFDKWRIEGFKVERAMDVDPSSPRRGLHCWLRALLDPTEGGLCLVFGVYSMGASETLCMRLGPCRFDGSSVELFWV